MKNLIHIFILVCIFGCGSLSAQPLGLSWAMERPSQNMHDVALTHRGNCLSLSGLGAAGAGIILHEMDSAGFTNAACDGNPISILDFPASPTVAAFADTLHATPAASNVTMSSSPVSLNQHSCDFVALDPAASLDISVSPNPTRGRIRVEYSFDGLRATGVEVYDLQGRMLLRKDAGTSGEGRMEIELNAHPAGIYLLRIRAGEAFRTFKVVKY